jgi:ADP-ribosylglycohydrolase
MLPANYLERVYAGFLGMNIGIRLGAPVEPEVWTFERIERVYGEIRDYVKPYRTFSADDDANGPIFFVRALYDDATNREMTAQDVARAWLNYAREGVGMFWWGGVGVSTEHTAYVNLRNGIEAPSSGSIAVNGEILAEQIGGQIFVDVWGLLWPGNLEKAALYAERAASVSHDRNGLYGARFIAACIAKAFEAGSVTEIVEAALAMIPEDSTYAKVVRAVMDFHGRHPDDWRACRRYLEAEWGYDKYGGVCHIIPNAGVCVLALLYGGGDYARTVEIATMCGWDTDCNAGNVGTIMGVFCGLDGIPDHYRKPVNDCIVASSVSGWLNIVDLPAFCKELALLACRLHGEEPPRKLAESVKPGELHFDFDLPGSTHGIRTSNPFKTPVLRHSREVRYGESGGPLSIDWTHGIEKITQHNRTFVRIEWV